MAAVAPVDWLAARSALDEAAGRVADLLRSVRDPQAPALGSWSIAEVATHLSQAFDLVPGFARPGGKSLIGDLAEMAGMTTTFVTDDPERDLGVLAERIERRAASFLEASAGAAATDPCPWLVEGTVASTALLTCHLLNESVVHAYDIAKADGRRWKVDRTAAALAFEGFLVPVIQAVDPRALVVPEKVVGVRARYQVRLRGGGSFCMVFDRGGLTIDGPGSGRVDCHLSADPAAFLLVAWGRISQWQAIPKGQLLAWGRRPWMGLRLRSMVSNP